MAIETVVETHSVTVDNEEGRAAGWLPGALSPRVLVIGHVATRWGLEHHINGAALEALAGEDFAWREGRECRLR